MNQTKVVVTSVSLDTGVVEYDVSVTYHKNSGHSKEDVEVRKVSFFLYSIFVFLDNYLLLVR